MDRIEFRTMARVHQSHQITIHSMVEHLIAQRGYYAVIGTLVDAVYNLGEISLADPENHTKLRDFDMWAQAVRTAILNHDLKPFESQLTALDRHFATEMKIR